MTQTDTNKQEENLFPRFENTRSSIDALALTFAPLALIPVAIAADVTSVIFAAEGWAAANLICTMVMSNKRIKPREAFATIAVCGLAGAFTGAAGGHFLTMYNEQKDIELAAQNSKDYAHVPVQDSVAIRYPAERFCENTDIKPRPFPNGEIRKIMLGADGNLVSVQCLPPRVTLGR